MKTIEERVAALEARTRPVGWEAAEKGTPPAAVPVVEMRVFEAYTETEYRIYVGDRWLYTQESRPDAESLAHHVREMLAEFWPRPSASLDDLLPTNAEDEAVVDRLVAANTSPGRKLSPRPSAEPAPATAAKCTCCGTLDDDLVCGRCARDVTATAAGSWEDAAKPSHPRRTVMASPTPRSTEADGGEVVRVERDTIDHRRGRVFVGGLSVHAADFDLANALAFNLRSALAPLLSAEHIKTLEARDAEAYRRGLLFAAAECKAQADAMLQRSRDNDGITFREDGQLDAYRGMRAHLEALASAAAARTK